MNCGNSGLSSSSEDSSSTSKSLQVQPSLDSPSFSPPSFVDSQPTFSLSPTKALLPFTTPPLSSMPPLPDLVVRTPPRRGSTASSTSSSSFSSYNSQHHNPPPLPPLPAIYSISRKPLPEEFRPEVQQVKQLEDKRARTRALLAAQALPSPPRKTEPRRRSTAPLASRVRVALEENWVGVDTTRERIVPTRRGAGDRTSSFGALEDARKNLARRSGFGIPLPTTTSSSRPQLSITNKSSRSSCLQDDSSVPPPPSPESGPSAFPPPQEPNLPSPDHISRFHPQRSQSTPAAGRDSPSSLHSAPSIASFRSRARTVSFAESPVHIDNDPFSIESEDEEEGSGAGLEEKRKDGGGWWKKGKKRVGSIRLLDLNSFCLAIERLSLTRFTFIYLTGPIHLLASSFSSLDHYPRELNNVAVDSLSHRLDHELLPTLLPTSLLPLLQLVQNGR